MSSEHLEIIHHPNYDKTVFMPFSPAIKVKSGKLLWLAGGTSLPVYHDHPHRREQIQQFMPNDLEAQTRRTMDGIMETLKAAGASPKDVVPVFIFRTRPRMGDIGRSSAVVNSYFAPHNHKPTTTNMAALERIDRELGEVVAKDVFRVGAAHALDAVAGRRARALRVALEPAREGGD